MNVLLFAKSADLPEGRIAQFCQAHSGYNVFVTTLIGVNHEPCSYKFDAVVLNLNHLLAAGITELRLEVEA